MVKKKPRHKRPKDPKTSTENLLKTLLKMGPKQLQKNEGKVAKMIDKEVSKVFNWIYLGPRTRAPKGEKQRCPCPCQANSFNFNYSKRRLRAAPRRKHFL